MESNVTGHPQQPVTGDKVESDSESTGSHDSTAERGQGEDDFEMVDVSPPSRGELVSPEAENLPDCPKQFDINSGSSSLEACDIEKSDSPVMIRSEFDLKLKLSSAQHSPECEQSSSKPVEAETGLNSQFDQALSFVQDKKIAQSDKIDDESSKNLTKDSIDSTECVQEDEEMEKSGKRKLLDEQGCNQEEASSDKFGDNFLTPQKQLKTAQEQSTETAHGDSNLEGSTSEPVETSKEPLTKLPADSNTSNRRRSFCQLTEDNLSSSSSPRRKQSHQENVEQLDSIPYREASNIINTDSKTAVTGDPKSTERTEPGNGRNDQPSSDRCKNGDQESDVDNDNDDDDDEDDENDESEGKQSEGMKLTKVLDYNFGKKKGFKFRFTVGVDIFHLALDENKLYCGVAIFEESNPGQMFFYPGKKSDVQAKNEIMEVEALVPESDAKKVLNLNYKYAVAESSAKNVAQDEPDLIRFSASGVQKITDRSRKAIDDTETKQTFRVNLEPDGSDNDDEESEEEEEENLGAKLLHVLEYTSQAKKKSCKVFKFTVGVDIFNLGLDENQMYCGVVISGGAEKLYFYPGRKTDVQTKTGIMEIEALVPEADLKSAENIRYQCAVAQDCSKNVAEDLNLIRFSLLGEQILTDRSTKLIDNTNTKQAFYSLTQVNSKMAPVENANEQAASNLDVQQSNIGTELEGQKSKSFKFLFSYEILELGIPDRNLHCGVVIFLLEAPQSSCFYPGTMVNTHVDNEKRLFEFEVTVPESEFRGNNFQYLYAVSDQPEKNIKDNKDRKLFGSQINTLPLPVEGTQIIDDRKVVQFFKEPNPSEQYRSQLLNKDSVSVLMKEQNQTSNLVCDAQLVQASSRVEFPDDNKELLTDDESNERSQQKSKLLMKVKEVETKKTGTVKISFCVGTGIFELGFDQNSVFCGVVVCTKDESQPFNCFYPGVVENTDHENGLLYMSSFIPLDDISDCKTIEWSCAVSQSPEKNVFEKNSDIIRLSELVSKIENLEAGQYFNDTKRVHFMPELKPKPAPRKKSGFESAVNRATVLGDIDKSGVGEEHDPKQQSVDQTANLSGYQNALDHPLNVNEEASLLQCFSVVQDNKRPSGKTGEPFWHFKFKVGLDIFDFGLKAEKLFCGVLVITERKGQKGGLFIPGVRVNIDEEEKRLEMEVVLPRGKIDVNKTFDYVYAVSELSWPLVWSRNPEAVVLSEKPEMLAVRSPKVVDDRDKVLRFQRRIHAIKETSRPQTRSYGKKETPTQIAVEFKKGDSGNEFENQAGSSSSYDNSTVNLIEAGFTLKDILGNPSMDKMREQYINKFAELNAVVGRDLLLLGHERLIFGVRTSVDNFTRMIPAYIVEELDGSFWLRIQVDMKRETQLQYKYVVAENIKSEYFHWEVMHRRGELNRKIWTCKTGQRLVKYDGMVTFAKLDEEVKPSGMWSKFWRKVKEITPGVRDGTDDKKLFYWQQNSRSLELYMRLCFQQLLTNELDMANFAQRGASILSSLAEINVGESSRYTQAYAILSEEDLLNSTVDLFLVIHDEFKMNSGDELQSFECQMAIVAIFVLIESSGASRSLISTLSNDILEKFLRSASFFSESAKIALQQKLAEQSSSGAAIENVCHKMLELTAVQNNVNYPVLVEWISIFNSKHFIKLPSILKLNQQVLAASQSVFLSVWSRRQLLLIYFSKPWDSLQIVQDLNLAVDEIIRCYHFVAAKEVSFKREDRLINLLLFIVQILKNGEDDLQKEVAVNFLDTAAKLLSLAGRNFINDFEMKWFNSFVTCILDSVEAIEQRGCRLTELGQLFCFHSFMNIISQFLSKANSSVKVLTTETVHFWGNVLRERKGCSNLCREIWEPICRQVFLDIVKRNINTRDLNYCFLSLGEKTEKIIQSNPNFDKSGVSGVLDEAVIDNFHRYLSATAGYHYDLDFSHWTTELSFTFARVASKLFPDVRNDMHHNDVVLKMIAWRPFISLIHLASRFPSATSLFQAQFNIVVVSFRQVLVDIDGGNLAFSFFCKLHDQKTMLKDVCIGLNIARPEEFDAILGNCSAMSVAIQSSFEEMAKLKTLVLKFKSNNIDINVSDLDELLKNWRHDAMNSFAKVDRRGKVTMTCKTLGEADVQALEKFSKYLKSRLFTDIAFREVRIFCQDESVVCTYVHLLHSLLKTIEQKYLSRADQLVMGQINAKDAQNLFQSYRETEKVEEIDFMFNFVKAAVIDPDQIKRIESAQSFRRQQISKLDSLCKNKDFVQALSDLKQVLQIDNNFLELETLSKLDNLDQLNLSQLTDKILKCSREFEEITKDQIHAIRAFVEQTAFYNWIKKKMKTLQDVKVVAELASMSAGEITYEIDKVKCFHDAIFGYSPFIYELNPNSSFADVKAAYEKVFAKLQTDPRLPNKYEDSAHQLSWFEKALETQGSVEKSSLEKAQQINNSGVYIVRYESKNENLRKVLIEAEDAVILQYSEIVKSENRETEEKRTLKLSDLRDLLSRLMLIVGKDKHEHAQSVDVFITTFQNIERLTSSFVTLYNSGCAFFSSWSVYIRTQSNGMKLPALEVKFSDSEQPLHVFTRDTNEELSSLCVALESIKAKWEQYVFAMRCKHPILNEFNMQQLSAMCSGLAKLNRNPNQLEPATKYYLESINQLLEVTDVVSFLNENYDSGMDIDDHTESFIYSNTSIPLEEITKSAHIDQRSALLAMIDNLKGQFNDNARLAKAGIEAVRNLLTESKDATQIDEAEVVNWIIENEEQDEIVAQFAQEFDDYFSTLDRTETTGTGFDMSGNKVDVSKFAQDMELIFDKYLSGLKENSLEDFVNLYQLGHVLNRCLEMKEVLDAVAMEETEVPRFPQHFKTGRPNFVLCDKRSDILLYILSLYCYVAKDRLPNHNQVLLCSSRTSVEELEVFLLRAMLDPRSKVYTIAFADDLSPACSDHIEKLLFDKVKQANSEYKLVVFNSDESSQVSVVLEKYKTKQGTESIADLRKYLCDNLKSQKDESIDQYCSRLITSTQPSSGKSLHIDRVEAEVKQKKRECARVILRLYDRHVDFERLLDFLWTHKSKTVPTIVHLDVSPNVLDDVDELLFKLCVLGGLSDDRGKLFLARKNFFLAIEMLQAQKDSCWKPLCDLMPSTTCLSPNQCMQNQNDNAEANRVIGADLQIINSPAFQRSYYYLELVRQGRDMTNSMYNGEIQTEQRVIQILKESSGLRNPTWAQLTYFANFLNEQLVACETNYFVTCGDFIGFKNFLIKHCLVKMAQDFALPSLSIADNSPLFGLNENQRNYEVHQMRRRWENAPHPYVFFNTDQITFTFLGVRVHDSNLKDWNDNILARNVMSADLQQQIKRQAYDESNVLDENFDQLSTGQKQTKLCRVLGVDQQQGRIKFDSTYELTQDNVMKLLAIYMRFRCNIPVVIMGETGCGKTRLIEFLCHLMARGENVENKKFVKVHGGVTMNDIVKSIEEAEQLAIRNSRRFGENFYTVLFFDEANTTEAIYGIKEVICDFSVNGRKLDPNSGLKVIVACNPYRKHEDAMIKKLESQGLGYHVKSSETSDKLDSDIPMRHLVYRVNPLPPSLLPLVWDFGKLTSAVENKYIRQIVAKKATSMRLNDRDVNFICNVLSGSQKFLRENRDQCLFVSLRDIERAMTVLQFFYSKKEQLLAEMDELDDDYDDDNDDAVALDEIARLVILTLGVCYHSSLEKRDDYRRKIALAFTGPYALPHRQNTIVKELDLCMKVFLKNITLDAKANIAKNLALTENVFMMIICIELRIPLFLVGKPGSSKSLAKTIVIDAMQGESSRNDFFQTLKQVQMLSFQCSPHTHADGILSTFKQAALYQKGKELNQFVSVVVLDEIGLAEDSAKMPLKTLHPLLEEGYVELNASKTDWGKVGFVGISNWALDPAKMNRGILVSRTIPTPEELVSSARGICRVENEGKALERLIQPLADAYERIYQSQIRDGNAEYFGLRDFYGLLKMLYRSQVHYNVDSSICLKWASVRGAIRRNFGEKDDKSLLIFADELKKSRVFEDASLKDKVDTLELVHDNIAEAEARSKMPEEQRNMDNESRYLLLMTENFSALQLLPQVLRLSDYEIIFGSSFPQDQEYIQVCKNINRIKVCMETGKTVVLLNLGSLYESLYDALNQYYVYYGGKRYVDLGLGSNRVKCSVSEDFRLIMIEEENVAKNFPIPLLNRLEKHFLGMESILKGRLMDLKLKLSESLEDFSHVPRSDKEDSMFQIRDAFVGYQKDTTACVLIQSDKNVDATEDQVLQTAMNKLVQTCSIEAIIRANPDLVAFNVDELKNMYAEQGRKSLTDFLWQQCYSGEVQSKLIEISTFCRIPSAKNIKDCNLQLMQREMTLISHERHFVINLNTFKTEIEFAERVKDFHRMAQKHPDLTKVLFVTCSKGQRFVQLIASAKYRLQNLQADANIDNLFTLFIVELPRNWYESGYSSFSVGKWESFHIDELLREEEYQVLTEVAIAHGRTLKDLFVTDSGQCTGFQRRLLRDVVHDAIADTPGGEKVQRVSNVHRLFEEHHEPSLEILFLEKASAFIEESEENAKLNEWVAEKAANLQELIRSGTIENALFTELKAKIKPHLSDFLKLIDFNNNIKLLFEANWRKYAWMRLFSVKELCRLRPREHKEVKFDSRFPFSAEISQSLSALWKDCLEMVGDSDLEDWQYFVERFENQSGILGTVLIEVSQEEDAVDSFLYDLIMNEFSQSYNNKFILTDIVKLIKQSLKAIMVHNLGEFGDAPTIAHAYAHFMKLLPHLHSITPILKTIGVKFKIESPVSAEAFAMSINQGALEQVKLMAEKLKPSTIDRQRIEELDQQVTVLKMCSDLDQQSAEFKFTLKKLAMLSTYMSQISFNLDEITAKAACTASDTLYKTIGKTVDDSVFGGAKFLDRLVFCLNRSAEAVILHSVEAETGQKDCAFCRKPVTVKGSIPYVVACPGHHTVHEACLTNSRERAARNERILCNFCNYELNCDVLDASYQFVCNRQTQKDQWKTFWENVSNVFLGIIREHVVPNCSSEALQKLVEYSLVYRNTASKKEIQWINDRSKQGLLTLLAINDQNQDLDNAIAAALQNDREIAANEIDENKTYDLLLAVFEFVHAHETLVDIDTHNDSTSAVAQIRLIAKIKFTIFEFIGKSIVGGQGAVNLHGLTVPRLIMDLVNRGGESSECLKRYFIQCVCKDHGMDLYQRIKTVPSLIPLIPAVLANSQSQGFSDIYLVYGDAYQRPFSQIYTTLVTDSNVALQQLNQVNDIMMRNLVAYRLLTEIQSNQNPPANLIQFRDSIVQNKVIQGLSQSIITANDKLSPRNDNVTQYLFVLQFFLQSNQNCGLMQPFRSIFANGGNVQNLFLPTFPDSAERKIAVVNQAIGNFTNWGRCPNGHLYLIGDCGQANEGGRCQDCGVPIGGAAHGRFHAGNAVAGARGAAVNAQNGQQVRGYLRNHNMNSFERPLLNEFNGNAMQFFIHAVLYICTGEQEMLARLQQNLQNIAANSLNRSQEDTLKFLLSLLLSSSRQNAEGSFNDETQRELWENRFITAVNAAQQNLPAVIAAYNDAFGNDSRNESNNLLQVLNEEPRPSATGGILDNGMYWRRTPKVTLASVRNELNSVGDNHQLLKCLFKNKYWLPLISNIPKLFEFFDLMICFYDPDQAHNVQTFDDFVRQRKIPELAKQKMKEAANIYCKLWNKDIRTMPATGGITCEFREVLRLDSPLKFFLPTRHVNECCALVTMDFLVNRSNELIHTYRSALQIETPVMTLSRGVVRDEHVADVHNIDRELLSVVANYSTCNLDTHNVTYNLGAIEATIGHKLFRNMPLISMRVMKMVTKSSSTEAALNNARLCIIDEEKLTVSMHKKIKNTFTDMPEVCKMLRQLVLLMKYLDKDRQDDPTQTIKQFLDNIKIEAIRGIEDVPVRACAFLWQALALQRTRLMLEHQGEEPYAGIRPEFREELSSDHQAELEKLSLKNKYKLMLYLNEVILLHLDKQEGVNPTFHIVNACLAPVYFEEEFDFNLSEWCTLKYAEHIMKHLIEVEN